MSNKYTVPFITYCYGLENQEMLINSGIPKDSIRLICDEPTMFDPLKEQYYHKIHAIQLAHEEFDCVLQEDFDVLPVRKWDDSIWDLLAKGSSFQANLYFYKRAKCLWRKEEQRKLTNGGCTYTRGKEPIDEIIKVWKRYPNKSVEPAMSRYLDELHGGWIGIEKYRELHEIPICNLIRNSPYGKYPTSPNPYLCHWAGLGNCKNRYMETK